MVVRDLGTCLVPRLLVPGSPPTVRADAADLRQRARVLVEAADLVQSITIARWEGMAADNWASRRVEVGQVLRDVAGVLETAAQGLDILADVLADAQATAEVAVTLWRAATRDLRAASTTIGAQGLVKTRQALADQDHARQVLAVARTRLATCEREVGQLLDALSDGLPDGNFHWGEFWSAAGQWFIDIGDMAWRLSNLRAVIDYQGYQRDVDATAQGALATVDALTSDPVGTVPVLLDLETMRTRPGQWWGTAAPDIVLGVATSSVGIGLMSRASAGMRAGMRLPAIANGAPEVAGVASGIAPSATFGWTESAAYRSTFLRANPDLPGPVVVHHAVEQGVLARYPGVVARQEMHSLENLRGIPTELNSNLHLRELRREWTEFYKVHPDATRQQLLDHATTLDQKYGSSFSPAVN